MRVRVLIISVVCLSATWAGVAAYNPLPRQKASFRSAIDLVLLNVSVIGPGGRYVADLTASDFEVIEDGRTQELAYFAPANVPLSVSLVLDTSSSMDDEMPLSRHAAKEFVGRLGPDDVAQIVGFDSKVEVLQSLTNDRTLLSAAIDRMRAGGATSLYNALYIVLRESAKSRPSTADDVRRQVIVVLSDGEDTSSLVAFDDVLDLARRSQTVIYTVGLGLDEVMGGRRSDGEFALRQLARETGGRLFVAKSGVELPDVYTQISNELTSQYVLGYLSHGQANGAWRRLSVRMRQPNLQARTRAGYYAPTP